MGKVKKVGLSYKQLEGRRHNGQAGYVKSCKSLFISSFLTIAKTWKKSNCPLRAGWINKMLCMCACVCDIYVLGITFLFRLQQEENSDIWYSSRCRSQLRSQPSLFSFTVSTPLVLIQTALCCLQTADLCFSSGFSTCKQDSGLPLAAPSHLEAEVLEIHISSLSPPPPPASFPPFSF